MITAAAGADALRRGNLPSAPRRRRSPARSCPRSAFALGAVTPKSWDGGWAKEATVAEFPVSEKLAGVLMSFAPGALRELHWHANAAEWAYVIKGQCRVTTIDPQGHCEIVDFGPGDVWYFPRGHGHSIQGIGREDCSVRPRLRQRLFLGVRDLQHQRLDRAHARPRCWRRISACRRQTFANFPKREVYIAKGPVPPPLAPDPAPGTLNAGALTHRYRLLAQRPQTYPGGTIRLVSQREFPISTTMTGALMRIKPGGLRELHWHPNADEWQYYIAGRARMSVFGSHGRVRNEQFNAGDVGYVPQGYGHYIENSRQRGPRTADRVQQRQLPIDLAHGLDRRQSASPAGDEFPRARKHVRDFPTRERFMPG